MDTGMQSLQTSELWMFLDHVENKLVDTGQSSRK
jgi:hypothetical protein